MEYFDNYGWKYGLRQLIFPEMKGEVFMKKIVNYMLRHYKGVDYDYIMTLPKKEDLAKGKLGKELAEIKNLSRLYNHEEPIEYQEEWYRRYRFKTPKEVAQYKRYFFRLYPKTKSYKIDKTEIQNAFAWFDLQYGLMRDFDEEL